MGNKTKRTPTEKLRLIGKFQLYSYLFIISWMLIVEILAMEYTNGGFGQNGYPVIWVPFGVLGILLIPSALIFIRGGKWAQVKSIRTARILQLILFVLVIAATYPSFIAASLTFSAYIERQPTGFFTKLLAPDYFVACVLGIISFPIMWRITRSLVPKTIKVPVDENQNLIKQ